jgi:hypothetical protein
MSSCSLRTEPHFIVISCEQNGIDLVVQPTDPLLRSRHCVMPVASLLAAFRHPSNRNTHNPGMTFDYCTVSPEIVRVWIRFLILVAALHPTWHVCQELTKLSDPITTDDLLQATSRAPLSPQSGSALYFFMDPSSARYDQGHTLLISAHGPAGDPKTPFAHIVVNPLQYSVLLRRPGLSVFLDNSR